MTIVLSVSIALNVAVANVVVLLSVMVVVVSEVVDVVAAKLLLLQFLLLQSISWNLFRSGNCFFQSQ